MEDEAKRKKKATNQDEEGTGTQKKTLLKNSPSLSGLVWRVAGESESEFDDDDDDSSDEDDSEEYSDSDDYYYTSDEDDDDEDDEDDEE